MSLGKRIAEKRKQKGLTQEALAKQLSVTASFISQIETGLRNPSYGLLQKISAELDTSVEFLIGGEVEGIEDPTAKIIASSMRFLDSDKKVKLLEYLYFLTGAKKYYELPVYDSPTEYAQYVLKEFNYNKPPIDPLEVAKSLGVRILFSEEELDYEGVLYKSGDEPLILLDQNITYKPRIKFTVAMLLGHLVIPWHLKSIFYRQKDVHSLEEEDQLSIEAREFAGALLIPPQMIRNDFKSKKPCLEIFEELAYNKYGSSMLVIGQKYVQSHGKTSLLITSDKKRFTRIYDAGFPYNLVAEVPQGSLAYKFINDPPKTKEIKKGFVDANIWLKNPPDRVKVYEESLLDPKFGITVTFLQILR
jgi:transcriptional regulator with XRE-family HTH domain